MSKFCSIKKRIGFDYKNRGRFLTDKIKLAGYDEKHVIEYYLELLKLIDVPAVGTEMELFVSSDAKSNAKQRLKGLGIAEADLKVGIVPGGGGSWGKDAQLKHWPADHFGLLADKLVDQKIKIVVLADHGELQVSRSMVKAMQNKPVDLSNKTSLEQLAAIVANLDLLICNDGGPLHMAKALKIKTVSIFGPVSEVVYGPYPLSKNDRVVKCDIPCRPCYCNFRMKECNMDRKCITNISVEQVFSEVQILIVK
ncbi:MAG: glycosyltransferase family 9 protein [Candidatus Omnitrophica bacterium]|nr:glycosyltransferase family 9 protein [Candidatus Omnitrophota bacterium]